MALSGRLPPGDMYPAGERDVRSRFVALSSGIRVRIVESGAESAPPIVLVPGWGCTAWIYRDTLPALAAAGFRAIAVELKGHGLSDKPVESSEYTLDAMRDHLVDILNALALPTAGLVGHSMGASIVMQAAVLAPDRLSGVALVAPVGFAGVKGMGLFRALTPMPLVPLLPYVATKFVVRTMLRLVYGELRQPDERDVDELRAPTQFPEYTRALRHLLHRLDWKTPLPEIAVPRLVIVGTKDHLSPARHAERYTDDENRAVIVDRAGHVLFNEAPTIVNAALASFFGARYGNGYISTE